MRRLALLPVLAAAPAASLADTTLWVAISVNRSGDGLLGATSHAFVDRAL